MTSPRRGLSGISFEGMVVALLFVAVAFGACLTVAQADTFWNLRAGQDIWQTGHVPRVDAYSFTAAGRPWPDHEWLWQAMAYGLFRAGGFPLLTAVSAGMIVAAVAIVYRLMVGAVSTRFLLVVLTVPIGSLVWTLRPQLATLLGMSALLALLARDRLRWLPLLFVVWANAHAGVALGGMALLVAFIVAWIYALRPGASEADGARARRLTLFLPLCALATTLTPLGFGIFRFVLESEARLRAARVIEWMPLSSMGPVPVGVFWLLVVALFVLLMARRRRLVAGEWADWVSVAIALVLLPFAARSARHVGLWLLLAPVAASRLLGADFRLRRRPAVESPDNPRLNAALVALIGGAAAVAVAKVWVMPLPRLGWEPLPARALAAVEACPGNLYNHYNQGGFLVWYLPQRKVFVDSRQDPFPLKFLLEHEEVEAGKRPYGPLFQRWDIRCSFLSKESPTVAALARAGWRTTYADPLWSVQVAP
jgi:hypothetical protein